MFHQINVRGKELDARLQLALTFEIEGEFDRSENLLQAIVKEFKNSYPRQIAYSHYLISVINRYKGNLNISLPHILKSLELIDLKRDTDYAHRIYGELGLVYQDMGNREKSIFWYRKAVAIREKMPGLAQIYIIRTIGFIVQQLILERKSAEALNEILEGEKRNPPRGNLEMALFAQIKGNSYTALGKFDLAEKNYLRMIKFYNLFPHSDNDELAQMIYYDIAKFYTHQHKYRISSRYIKKLLVAGHSIRMKMNVEYLMFKQDSATNNYMQAINHFNAYKELSDTIFTMAKTRQIEEFQIKYRTYEREKDIAILRKTEALQQERITSSDKIRNLTYTGIVLLIILVALLFNGYRLKQKSNKDMHFKNKSLNKIIEEKDTLLVEKQWLLKEIHHRVKNNLQIVMGLLQRQSAYITNEDALAAFQNSENRMHSIALIHQKLYQSQDLSLIYMPEYINELISYLAEASEAGNRLLFEKILDDVYLDVSQATPLGLILNEALTNAIKYAYPNDDVGNILVSLTADENYIVLTIADYGRGLPSGFILEKSTSLGLNLIKGLSKQLAAKLDFENHGGLTIKLVFAPVRENLHSNETY